MHLIENGHHPKRIKPAQQHQKQIVSKRGRKREQLWQKEIAAATKWPDSLLIHKPTCPETKFTAQMGEFLLRWKLMCGFLTFIPMRIGQSPCVDAAGLSIMEAIERTSAQQPRSLVKKSTTPLYSRAASALRSTLSYADQDSRDNALLAAALLTCYEWNVAPKGNREFYAHTHGITAILLSLPWTPGQEISEVTRAVIHWHYCGTFLLPIALGMPSPFECSPWLDADNAVQGPFSSGAAKLSKLSKDLWIRLPRLIAMLRRLRTSEYDELILLETIDLANELCDLRDQDAETDVLHDVTVKKTKHPADAYIIPYSFHFEDNSRFAWAVMYWQTRIFMQKAYLQLREIAGDHACLIYSSEWLHAENVRTAKNLLMTWEYAFTAGAAGFWALRLGILAIWGVVSDVDQWSRTLASAKVRVWLLQRYSDLHRGEAQFTTLEMDDAVDLLVGGPLKGFLTEIRCVAPANENGLQST